MLKVILQFQVLYRRFQRKETLSLRNRRIIDSLFFL